MRKTWTSTTVIVQLRLDKIVSHSDSGHGRVLINETQRDLTLRDPVLVAVEENPVKWSGPIRRERRSHAGRDLVTRTEASKFTGSPG